jgi:fatty acid desaturase
LAAGSKEDDFPFKELTRLVRDLTEPSPQIYWANLVIGLVIVVAGVVLSRPFPGAILSGSPLAIVSFIAAAFAAYRLTYLNHEIAHQGRKLRGFELAWNVTVGVPLLIPSFIYSDHRNHHDLQSFGTETDVEYFSPALRGFRGAVVMIALCFILPFVFVFRFLVLAPVAWISPPVRRWVDTRASSLGNLGLGRREPPTAAERPSWRIQELACFLYLAAVAVALMIRPQMIATTMQLYALFVGVLFLHSLRVMVGHRYETEKYPQGRIGQILDSYNFTRNPLVTKLMAPLGFHLHALHHLFPNIPFHNMPEAHRRIMAALPANSPYHAAEATSFFAEVGRFILRRGERPAVSVSAPAE